MKPRLFTAVLMFLSSYSPLMVILAARDFDFSTMSPNNPEVVLTGLALALISCFLLRVVIGQFRGGENARILSIENRSVELLNYTIPYLISFLPLNIGAPAELIAFSLFMLLMFWLTYKTDNLYMNPVMTFLGYNLYRVKVDISGQEYDVNALVKQELRQGDRIFLEKIARHVYIEPRRQGS